MDENKAILDQVKSYAEEYIDGILEKIAKLCGDKEEKTRNPIIATVGNNIR